MRRKFEVWIRIALVKLVSPIIIFRNRLGYVNVLFYLILVSNVKLHLVNHYLCMPWIGLIDDSPGAVPRHHSV